MSWLETISPKIIREWLLPFGVIWQRRRDHNRGELLADQPVIFRYTSSEARCDRWLRSARTAPLYLLLITMNRIYLWTLGNDMLLKHDFHYSSLGKASSCRTRNWVIFITNKCFGTKPCKEVSRATRWKVLSLTSSALLTHYDVSSQLWASSMTSIGVESLFKSLSPVIRV